MFGSFKLKKLKNESNRKKFYFIKNVIFSKKLKRFLFNSQFKLSV